MKYTKFPQILKQLRTAKGMTQADLADVLKVSRSTIAGYEARYNQPDYDKLVQIADLYNVTVDFLLSGEIKCPQDSNARLYSDKVLNQQLIEAFQPLPYKTKLNIIEYVRYHKEKHSSDR